MTDTEARCDLTELPKAGCAHCRGHRDPVGGDQLTDDDIGARFEASYSSRCDNCDGPIRPGDVIAALADRGGYACHRCLP